jgi:hypothetical protein
MESTLEHYRRLAEEARQEAKSADLPHVKARQLRSAEHFDALANNLEGVARCKARNEAARAQAGL